MSVAFRDGPASDVELEPQRVPMFLRIVVDTRTSLKANGRPPKAGIDCLDLTTDEPREHERIEVYERVWGTGPMHFCSRGHGRRTVVSGLYAHRPDVDGEQFRDTARWREWANAEGAEVCGAVPLSRRRPECDHPPQDQAGVLLAHPTLPPPPDPPPPDELAARRS